MGDVDIIIIYGSETGTAQDFAYSLAHRIRYLSLKPMVCSMDSLDLTQLFEVSTVLLISSTTGQGELPRNCKKFYKFLMRRNLPTNFLEHIKFSTCGLGDSSYALYNYAIRKFHARFLQLGALELCNRAECDEQSPEGQEAFYNGWEKLIFEALKKKYSNKIVEIPDSIVLEPEYKIKIDKDAPKVDISEIHSINRSNFDKSLRTVKLSEMSRMTDPAHFQDVIKVVISDESKSLKYQVGDTISLYPENDFKDVQSFINLQGWNDVCDQPLSLECPEHIIPEGGWVKNLTLRSLLQYHLDIMTVPPRSFFQLAWHFASDDREMEKLKELGKIEESEQLYDYVNRPHRSILEVVQEFFSLKIPVEQLLEVIPVIKPRLFSICNLPNPETVEIAVAIVEYKTIIRRIRKGLCTSWLKSLKVNDKIVITVNSNNLKIPKSDMILVGPGTGIAPIRSIIQFNDKLIRDGENGHNYLLFTGHRHKEKDYLFGEEWPTMKGLNVVDSFSRQGGGYVQETIWKHNDQVASILNSGGGLYLCGSSGKMPTQVRLTIEEILKESNKWDEQTAKAALLKMEKEKRYIQETW
ncbi:NAPDH-dependent diflavin reductase [Pichia californica]|uniref:NAPDH-dependent diflavin reductase n=1 Tax=Pichia californica TaxID=460514 RepID=A0A9P6WIV7_9ASCO|nr:NAPDH-dependent diflavin reductase [[Candida] californica]KAG0687951.1 NAPDH-dependent diflavin reductase [[Candida] californica]